MSQIIKQKKNQMTNIRLQSEQLHFLKLKPIKIRNVYIFENTAKTNLNK